MKTLYTILLLLLASVSMASTNETLNETTSTLIAKVPCTYFIPEEITTVTLWVAPENMPTTISLLSPDFTALRARGLMSPPAIDALQAHISYVRSLTFLTSDQQDDMIRASTLPVFLDHNKHVNPGGRASTLEHKLSKLIVPVD